MRKALLAAGAAAALLVTSMGPTSAHCYHWHHHCYAYPYHRPYGYYRNYIRVAHGAVAPRYAYVSYTGFGIGPGWGWWW
jgi:hypothetical protein